MITVSTPVAHVIAEVLFAAVAIAVPYLRHKLYGKAL